MCVPQVPQMLGDKMVWREMLTLQENVETRM